MERRPVSGGGRAAACALLVLAAGCGGTADSRAAEAPALDTALVAPDRRITIEVQNGTETHRLARRGMQWLRALGYDVVAYGNAREPVAETRVVVHAGDSLTGVRIARAFGNVPVRAAAAPSPYVDFVVLLGDDWRPPAEPFRP